MSALLALKLSLAPLLTVTVGWAIKKWGNTVGGFLLGMPLIAGPISLLFSLQHGIEFAQAAAHGTVLGLFGVMAFMLCYYQLANRLNWAATLILALLTFVAGCAMAYYFSPRFSLAVFSLVALLSVALSYLSSAKHRLGHFVANHVGSSANTLRWDLPVRLAVVSLLTFTISSLAPWLGERLSGLISPIPVFTIVFTAMAHRNFGPQAAQKLLRGALSSLLGFVAFFAVLHCCPVNFGIAIIYGIATIICASVNVVVLKLL